MNHSEIETLAGIKALMIECSLALDSIQDVGLQQTGQLEILTNKIMGLSSDVERMHGSLLITKGTLTPPFFQRPWFLIFLSIFAGIGFYTSVSILPETVLQVLQVIELWR